MLKFPVDESTGNEVAGSLQNQGHDVITESAIRIRYF